MFNAGKLLAVSGLPAKSRAIWRALKLM